MSPEKDDALVKDFPHLFADRSASFMSSSMGFGFQCEDGWEPLIRKAAEKLEPLIVAWIDDRIKTNTLDEMQYGIPRASCVKEKYGTLSLYMECPTDEMEQVVHEAAEESAVTCEQCGAPGELRGKSWYFTMCDGCWEKHTKGRGYDKSGSDC